jgi:hypothetical protein
MSSTNFPSGRELGGVIGAWGEEITDRDAARHEAEVAQRVEAASHYWPRAELDEFELIGNSWRPVFVRRSDGVEFRLLNFDPFLQQNPAASGVECWLQDAGGQLLFLRRRGALDVPVAQTVPGRFYAGRVEQTAGGQFEVVDVESGAKTKLASGALRQ